MRLAISVVLMVTPLWGTSSVAQDDSAKVTVSKEALTAEQVAVYRVVLKNYLKGSNGTLNLSNTTYPLDLGGPLFDEGCVKGVKLEKSDESHQVVHLFESALPLAPNVTLVDPKQQSVKVKQNDPQDLLKKAIDEHQTVTDKQLGTSVQLAFSTGLFSFSEIVFGQGHRDAVLSYSFVCGILCGHGNTLRLERAGYTWKIRKTCGSWIS